MGTVREESVMSRYIEADKVLKELRLNYKDVIYIDKNDTAKRIEKIPSIDIADYVPKDFHDKTCEAMAKAHQEEIADMVSVVRCSECKKSHIDGKTTHYLWCTEWGRSTDTFGYCERGEREGE